MLVDRHRVDDVLQEAYVRAHRALPRFRRDADLGTWLHRITYNCCVDELRAASDAPARRGPRRTRADASAAPAARSPCGRPVRAALAELPEDQRAAVLLVDGSAMDYSAAAEVLGVPRARSPRGWRAARRRPAQPAPHRRGGAR